MTDNQPDRRRREGMTDRPRSIESGEGRHGSEGLTGSFGGGSRLGASVAGGRGVFRWSLREEYERLGLHQAPGLQRVANQVRRSRRRRTRQQQLASQRPGILVILTTALSEDGPCIPTTPPVLIPPASSSSSSSSVRPVDACPVRELPGRALRAGRPHARRAAARLRLPLAPAAAGRYMGRPAHVRTTPGMTTNRVPLTGQGACMSVTWHVSVTLLKTARTVARG